MSKNVVAVLVIGAIVGYLVISRNNPGGIAGGDNGRAPAAVSLGGGTLGGNDIIPGPNPSPNVKPNRSDCKICAGTGWVKHGDGHVTECTNCIPDKSTPFDVRAELQKAKEEAKQEALDELRAEQELAAIKKEAEEAKAKATVEEKEKDRAVDVAPADVADLPPVPVVDEKVQHAETLLVIAAEAFKNKEYEKSAMYVSEAKALLGEDEDNGFQRTAQPKTEREASVRDRVRKAEGWLKYKGVPLTPVYVIDKEKMDKYIKYNESLKKAVDDWKVYHANEMAKAEQANQRYGFGAGSCEGGSCGMGGGMMMGGGGSCGGGSCGGGGGGGCGAGGCGGGGMGFF